MKRTELKRNWLLALVGLFILNTGVKGQTSINETATLSNNHLALIKVDRNNIDLPKTVVNYINTHFIDNSIKTVDRSFVSDGVNYTVHLEDGVQLDFDDDKKLIEIKSDIKIPENVIPPYIELYVKEHYPNEMISEWIDKKDGHLIKLSSDEYLFLNIKGNFVKVKTI